jgi:hypothetical protein
MLSSMLHRRRPQRRDLIPGRYLTDGRRLLWVVGRFEIPGSMLVSVEDCSTFERHVYADVELDNLRFRRVRIPAQPPLPASGACDPVDMARLAGGESVQRRDNAGATAGRRLTAT